MLLAVFGLIWALVSCGQQVELEPELQAHVDEYEALIRTYEAKFAEARSDPAKLAEVADSYSREVKAWIGRWANDTPDFSDEEGRVIKAHIDRLNERAEKMLRGE